MAVSLVAAAVFFLVSFIVSAIIIFAVTKLFGEREGIGTALLAALVGAIIYALAYYFLGQGLLAALVGGFVWLLALGSLYNMGWFKALVVAVVVWIVSAVVGFLLPTAMGPL